MSNLYFHFIIECVLICSRNRSDIQLPQGNFVQKILQRNNDTTSTDINSCNNKLIHNVENCIDNVVQEFDSTAKENTKFKLRIQQKIYK